MSIGSVNVSSHYSIWRKNNCIEIFIGLLFDSVHRPSDFIWATCHKSTGMSAENHITIDMGLKRLEWNTLVSVRFAFKTDGERFFILYLSENNNIHKTAWAYTICIVITFSFAILLLAQHSHRRTIRSIIIAIARFVSVVFDDVCP